MNILDFIKNVGSDLFGKGKSENEAIEEHVSERLRGKIDDLSVSFSNGTATLTGSVASQADKEKAILLAGNVKGVEKVLGEGLSVRESTTTPTDQARLAEAVQVEFYTVEKGDTLSEIAQKFYKSASKYQVIFEANREVIKDPDLIYPGQKIRIPKQ